MMQKQPMMTIGIWGNVLLGAALLAAMPVEAGEVSDAVQEAGLRNGILVVIQGDDEAYADAVAAGLVVRGLEIDKARIEALRARLVAGDNYGKVSVAEFDGKTLPFIDSLVNLVVDYSGGVAQAEVLRALVPGGSALCKQADGWKTAKKAFPDHMGEWNQWLCNGDNNGVTRDSAGPPERLQWTAGSRYGRTKYFMPSVTSMVTANGRIFTIEDMASPETGDTTHHYVLLARDAFNGCELWQKPLANWGKRGLGGPVKIIPAQLQRLLIAVGDKVYCTDGYDGPITVFDGSTGKMLTTFKNSNNTREMVYDNGVIYAIHGQAYAIGMRVASPVHLKLSPVRLSARDGNSGEALWEVTIQGYPDGYIGGSIATKGDSLCYLSQTGLACLNNKTGAQKWRVDYANLAEYERKKPRTLGLHNMPPTLLLTDNRVFCTDINEVRAYSLTDGNFLWETKTKENYCKTGDLFYHAGMLWTTDLEALDPATGEVKQKLKQTRIGPMVHPRCYRNRITDTYYINSMTGGTDLLGLDGKSEFPSPWMRATCGLAMTPSYGRLYSSPYVCACEIGSMLLGFNCTYTEDRAENNGKVMEVQPTPRLIKGPAFAQRVSPRPHSAFRTPRSSAWPMYRHDNARSGVASTAIPKQLQVKWRTPLPGQSTAPVIADGLLLVAIKDMHTIVAVDATTGKRKWTFIADGLVDSPPTLFKGLALFGCRSGWVYCLDAQSGELVWKFSDMPSASLMCSMGKLESAWPVNGSVMVRDDLVYFAAGRSSFLDGGIVVYALKPHTGDVVHRSTVSGPFDDEFFPRTQRGATHRSEGCKGGIFSESDGNLYIRHQGFTPDLSPISPYKIEKPHLMASTGFLCSSPQHRTYWSIDTDLSYAPGGGVDSDGPQGDIISFDGDIFYEVRGDAPGRHPGKVRDSRKKYRIVSGEAPTGRLRRNTDPLVGDPGGPLVPKMGRWRRRWSAHIPMAGHALVVGGNTMVIAGVPMYAHYDKDDIEASYDGRQGGLLWTVDKQTGAPLGKLDLPAAPVWDGLAAAGDNVYLPLKDGSILCLGAADEAQEAPTSTMPAEWIKIDAAREEARQLANAPVTLYRDDFESQTVNHVPEGVSSTDESKGARIIVTDAVAASGKQSLAFHDAAGLPHSWQPIYTRSFSGSDVRDSGTLTLSFDVMVSAKEPGELRMEMRDYTQRPPQSGVAVIMNPDGYIQVGNERLKAPNGSWHTVKLTLELGGGKTVKGSVTGPDGTEQPFEVPVASPEFSALTWFSFYANSDSPAVTYVDNVLLRVSSE